MSLTPLVSGFYTKSTSNFQRTVRSIMVFMSTFLVWNTWHHCIKTETCLPSLPWCCQATRLWRAPSCPPRMSSPSHRGRARCCHLRNQIHLSKVNPVAVLWEKKKSTYVLAFGPDIRAAPLSEVKKTNVFVSISRLRSVFKIWPTLKSSSITASPYLWVWRHSSFKC